MTRVSFTLVSSTCITCIIILYYLYHLFHQPVSSTCITCIINLYHQPASLVSLTCITRTIKPYHLDYQPVLSASYITWLILILSPYSTHHLYYLSITCLLHLPGWPGVAGVIRTTNSVNLFKYTERRVFFFFTSTWKWSNVSIN